MNKNLGFYKHEKIRENQKIVNRSSALFLVKYSKKEKIYTDFHFLNYWLIKGNLKNVKIKITIRDLNGKKLLSNIFFINDLKSYCVKLETLLEKKNIQNFTGTGEIEIFSKKNLFFPYPAVYARYHGKNWHAGTHSTTRYFSKTSGDDTILINKKVYCNESNISLLFKKDVKCFIVLHNGFKKTSSSEAKFTVTNHLGQNLSKSFKNFKMKIGETKIMCVDDYINYKDFLDGKRGMLTVNYSTTGVFPRILYYNQDAEGKICLEHSNFGLNKHSSSDIFKPKKSSKNLLYSIPVMPKNYKTEVDFFPTYPTQKSSYVIKIRKNSLKGKNLTVKKIKLSKKRPYVQLNEIPSKETTFLDIDITNKNKLPNRFHIAQYYSKNKSLPGIILDGPFPHHTPGVKTRWTPFFSKGKDLTSKIYICSRSFNKNTFSKKIDVNILLIGGIKKEKIEIIKTLNSKENFILNVSSIIKKNKWKSDYGWAYIKFKEPSHNTVFFLSDYGKNSIVSNHAF